MMDVRVERQRKPNVNVWEKHPLRPESRRFVRQSNPRCPVGWSEPGGLGFVVSQLPAWGHTALDTTRARQPLRVTKLRPQERPRRFVLDQELPYRHCRRFSVQDQAPRKDH
jgi:hypothetical protein